MVDQSLLTQVWSRTSHFIRSPEEAESGDKPRPGQPPGFSICCYFLLTGRHRGHVDIISALITNQILCTIHDQHFGLFLKIWIELPSFGFLSKSVFSFTSKFVLRGSFAEVLLNIHFGNKRLQAIPIIIKSLSLSVQPKN